MVLVYSVLVVAGVASLITMGTGGFSFLWEARRPWMIESLYEICLGMYLLVYLNLPDVREWFRTRTKEQRVGRRA
jgi:hypothetical protein